MVAERLVESRIDFLTEQGERTAMITIVRDVTERARLEDAERRTRAAAEAAVRSRDELLATIAHDLKNPLASIQGYSQLLRRRAERGEQVASAALVGAAGQIEASARRMAAMIDDLVDTARLQMGDVLPLDRRPIDLVALVRRVADAHQRTTERHRIVVDASGDAPAGVWDAARLERVLDNLVANAVKYSPAGGDVVVRVLREGDAAVVTVTDHGLGIPAADIPRVFDRFHRGANVQGQISGTGIGLASVRQIVEQHGGTVDGRKPRGMREHFHDPPPAWRDG